jgi:hypothetical protein
VEQKRPIPDVPIAPKDVVQGIFVIYTVGSGYDTRINQYGSPAGIGILVSDVLALTTYNVLQTAESAVVSYAQFKDGEVFDFDPKE